MKKAIKKVKSYIPYAFAALAVAGAGVGVGVGAFYAAAWVTVGVLLGVA